MTFVLLAFLAGAAVGTAAVSWPALPAGVAASSDTVHSVGDQLGRSLGDLGHAPPALGDLTAATLGAVLPGLLLLLLAETTRATVSLRRTAGMTLVLAGVVSFTVVPASTAMGATAAAAVLAVMLWLATGPLLVSPVAFGTGLVTVLYGHAVLTGRSDYLTRSAAALTEHLPLPWHLWLVALSTVAVLPVAAALRAITRP